MPTALPYDVDLSWWSGVVFRATTNNFPAMLRAAPDKSMLVLNPGTTYFCSHTNIDNGKQIIVVAYGAFFTGDSLLSGGNGEYSSEQTTKLYVFGGTSRSDHLHSGMQPNSDFAFIQGVTNSDYSTPLLSWGSSFTQARSRLINISIISQIHSGGGFANGFYNLHNSTPASSDYGIFIASSLIPDVDIPTDPSARAEYQEIDLVRVPTPGYGPDEVEQLIIVDENDNVTINVAPPEPVVLNVPENLVVTLGQGVESVSSSDAQVVTWLSSATAVQGSTNLPVANTGDNLPAELSEGIYAVMFSANGVFGQSAFMQANITVQVAQAVNNAQLPENPADGLVVIDVSNQSFYRYQDDAWIGAFKLRHVGLAQFIAVVLRSGSPVSFIGVAAPVANGIDVPASMANGAIHVDHETGNFYQKIEGVLRGPLGRVDVNMARLVSVLISPNNSITL